MVKFEKHVLQNGLTVIAHQDNSTPIAALNVLYKVGSKNENPDMTGLAHLFEHLMFEGSENVKNFDIELQSVGGENNAFTNNDLTNYYLTLPVKSIETAFFIESDRMSQPAFSEEKLITQKNVVIEEFKQSYLNQPYGDVMHLLRPLCYKAHPYMWPTIGKKIEHVEKVQMKHVKDFFNMFYKPDNAVISIAGNMRPDKVFELAEKWFGHIEPSHHNKKTLPAEPFQNEKRFLKVERDVPFNDIYIAFHTVDRFNNDYAGIDLISDILGSGNSSRLYRKLIKDNSIFSKIDAFISGSIEPGLLIINGRMLKNEGIESAEKEIFQILNQIKLNDVKEDELQKVKNKIEVANAYADINVLSKAMNLAYFEYLGDANLINLQNEQYFSVSTDDISRIANDTFTLNNTSVIHYCAKK